MTTEERTTRTAVPAWVTQTPDANRTEFILIADRGGEWIQDIDLTRAEFIEVKRHLAEMRGLTPRQ